MDDVALSETLDLIYETAVAPDRWSELLQRLACGFDCHFVGMNISSANRDEFRAVAVGVDRAEHQAFLRRFNRNLPVALRVRPGLADGLIDASTLITRSEMERTEMYQAFYRPNDIGRCARMTVWSSHSGSQAINLCRPWRAAAFGEAEHSLARTLIPHLQRSAQVARHLHNADLLTNAAHATLDALPHPVLLLHRAGGLVYANREAEHLLRAADGLLAGRERLSGASASATRSLEALVAAAARDPGKGGTLRLPRPSGKTPLVLVAIPIGGFRDFVFPDQPAVILCVADPTSRDMIAAGVLTAAFGLTPAEAELARQLLAGHELPAIAASSGRSVHTVRNLLARVMAKTETGRQSELVGLLGRLPRTPPTSEIP
jgi:DNA-binding CsgD family transcriptional regulator